MRHILKATILCAMFVGFGCDDFWHDPEEKERPAKPDAGCPTLDVELSIASYPTSDPVVADTEVFGTLSGNDVRSVKQIGLGVVKPDDTTIADVEPVAITAATTWSATIPIEVLLGPNAGPGDVRIEAVALRDGCEPIASDQSETFTVAYPPTLAPPPVLLKD